MANKDNRRGNKEIRKPKQEKAKPTAAASPFIVNTGRPAAGKGGKKG